MTDTKRRAGRSGGRAARVALRAAPLSEDKRPIRPGMSGGTYKPLSDADIARIHATALDALEQVGLMEVAFEPDNRTQFITGLVLDHVFYRGLEVEKAKAPITDASDHNPMRVTFKAK